MKKSKEEIYKEQSEKSRNRFSTSFYYVDSGKAEKCGVIEFKAPAKDHFIRIISPDLSQFWGLEVAKHTNIGPNRATFLCMEQMFEKECPICEMIKELREKDPQDEKIKALKCSYRYLVFLYDVENGESERKGLRWYDMPTTVKDEIMGQCQDKRTGKFTEVEHPVDGKDIEFRRVGTTRENTKYSGFKLVNNDPIPKEWTEDVPAFEDILRIPKPEDVQKELLGMTSEPKEEISEEEVEDRESRKSSREDRGRDRGRRDEEKEKVEVEDQPEEKTPRRRSRSRESSNEDSPKDENEKEGESRRERARKKAKDLAAKIEDRNKK